MPGSYPRCLLLNMRRPGPPPRRREGGHEAHVEDHSEGSALQRPPDGHERGGQLEGHEPAEAPLAERAAEARHERHGHDVADDEQRDVHGAQRSEARQSPRARTSPQAASPPNRTSPVHRRGRSEEHTSELQSRQYLVCRLLLEKKKTPKDHEMQHQPVLAVDPNAEALSNTPQFADRAASRIGTGGLTCAEPDRILTPGTGAETP